MRDLWVQGIETNSDQCDEKRTLEEAIENPDSAEEWVSDSESGRNKVSSGGEGIKSFRTAWTDTIAQWIDTNHFHLISQQKWNQRRNQLQMGCRFKCERKINEALRGKPRRVLLGQRGQGRQGKPPLKQSQACGREDSSFTSGTETG